MFAKSKRFQEGVKDYIPGPGEYNVPTEDAARTKRYGFNPGQRFTDSMFTVDSNVSDFTYAVGEHSLPSVSTISNGSKNEDKSRNTTITHQFEKYRQAMQKEIELLQSKSRKLESNLHSMTTEKTELQASALEKELELADMRQKNNALQKTISRHEKAIEKSPRIVQLQKRLEQMEKELEAAKQETLATLTTLNEDRTLATQRAEEHTKTLDSLHIQMEEQVNAAKHLAIELEQSQAHARHVEKTSQEALQSLRRDLEQMSNAFTQATYQLQQKDTDLAQFTLQLTRLGQEHEQLRIEHTQLQTHHTQLELDHEEACKTHQTQHTSLSQANERLQHHLTCQTDTLNGVQFRLAAEEQENARHLWSLYELLEALDHSDTVRKGLQSRFRLYQQHMQDVLQDLFSKKEHLKRTHAKTHARLTDEMYEAKKFINQQALQMEGLKSDLHWLTAANRQLHQVIQALHLDTTRQAKLYSRVHHRSFSLAH
ncbi:hypothetical protein BDF14DRAFT_1877659 [Spinellus fusiger]|nr:hypothetical protein BDF14DRAFT_1877659 [Spinellus fusiger]